MSDAPIQDAIRLLCGRGCAIILPDHITIKAAGKDGTVATATATHEVVMLIDECGFASVQRGKEIMP